MAKIYQKLFKGKSTLVDDDDEEVLKDTRLEKEGC